MEKTMQLFKQPIQLRRVLSVVALSALLGLGAGCSQKVTRVDSNAVTDLSGMWNDTDSRLVSQEMIKDVLYAPVDFTVSDSIT